MLLKPGKIRKRSPRPNYHQYHFKFRTGNKSTTDRRLQNRKRLGSQKKQQPTAGIKKRKRQNSAVTQHSSSATSRGILTLSFQKSKNEAKTRQKLSRKYAKEWYTWGEHSTQDCKKIKQNKQMSISMDSKKQWRRWRNIGFVCRPKSTNKWSCALPL